MFDCLESKNETLSEPGGIGSDNRMDVDYSYWMRQNTELAALRFLVVMQLLGILILAIAIGYLLFRGY